MNENEGYWGGRISIISQNFPKSPSILFHPLDSSISQTSPYGYCLDQANPGTSFPVLSLSLFPFPPIAVLLRVAVDQAEAIGGP
jgi:hypothetical protein